jgi:acetoacetyl-CoA reductase
MTNTRHVAVVTGGVTGIGLATALALKARGHTVVAGHLAQQTAADLARDGYGLACRQWDVSDFAATQAALNRIEQEFGPVGILVNNAGITADAVLHKMTLDQWRRVIDVDLGGCFNTCRAVIGGMRERRFGRIINVSSVNALSGQFGQTNYSAAKAGVIGFTKALALESASCGITVNAIAPGYTDTDMVRAVPAAILEKIVASVPVGRLAKPEEIARTIVFLADDDAGFMTGATLSVNGGKFMH